MTPAMDGAMASALGSRAISERVELGERGVGIVWKVLAARRWDCASSPNARSTGTNLRASGGTQRVGWDRSRDAFEVGGASERSVAVDDWIGMAHEKWMRRGPRPDVARLEDFGVVPSPALTLELEASMAKKRSSKKKARKKAGKKTAKRTAKKATKRAGKKAGKRTTKRTAKKSSKRAGKRTTKKAGKKKARKKARRTVLYSTGGTKLYAVRDGGGKFKDIQRYSRAHAMDIARSARNED